MNPGIDLQASFVQALTDLGLPRSSQNPLAAPTHVIDDCRGPGWRPCLRLVGEENFGCIPFLNKTKNKMLFGTLERCQLER